MYAHDVWSRLPTLHAAATSTQGYILKIDSTKKVSKKLSGTATGSASWTMNVGNERDEMNYLNPCTIVAEETFPKFPTTWWFLNRVRPGCVVTTGFPVGCLDVYL